jgi:hypothetical protein
VELPRFKNGEDANVFFFKHFNADYNRMYMTIIYLMKHELDLFYTNDTTKGAPMEDAEDLFAESWNYFLDYGIPEYLSTRNYPARVILLAQLMRDIKKEVCLC